MTYRRQPALMSPTEGGSIDVTREWLVAHYSPTALSSAWGAIVLGYVGFALLERVIPGNRHPTAKELATDLRANLVYWLLQPVAVLLGGATAAVVAARLNGPQFRIDLAPTSGGAVAAFFLAFVPLFAYDFFYYWFHRLQHASSWLWEVHRLHHSESALNVMTNFRHHWLEEFFRAFLLLLPMNWLLSIGPATSAVAAVLLRQWSNFFHANIRVGLGPLAGVIVGPQYHRIHHSIEVKHIDHNFAAFFPLWDWLFGTHWSPDRGEWPEVGLIDTTGVCGFPEILFAPFIGWARTFAVTLTGPRKRRL
jgi:sterol desaturase/sphingolipid hydroxylase (fatty acid hydroxylase superfamily)